jgi:hypothetical protein
VSGLRRVRVSFASRIARVASHAPSARTRVSHTCTSNARPQPAADDGAERHRTPRTVLKPLQRLSALAHLESVGASSGSARPRANAQRMRSVRRPDHATVSFVGPRRGTCARKPDACAMPGDNGRFASAKVWGPSRVRGERKAHGCGIRSTCVGLSASDGMRMVGAQGGVVGPGYSDGRIDEGVDRGDPLMG